MQPTRCPPIGSVSERTLSPDDLAASFAEVLRQYAPERFEVTIALAQGIDQVDGETQDEIIEDLCNALNEIAPPYTYFGAHEGDGADFGFWPDRDRAWEDIRNKTLRVFADIGRLPKNLRGCFVHDGALWVRHDRRHCEMLFEL